MGLRDSIDLTGSERRIVDQLLNTYVHDLEVWAYGSRVKWSSHTTSDLDLVVFAGPNHAYRVARLRDAFDESDLPFRVDVHIWDRLPNSFHKHITEDYLILHSKSRIDHSDSSCTTMQVGEFVSFAYGKSLPASSRNDQGNIRMYGSNGVVGYHDDALTDGPTVIVGRKGTVGAVHYSPTPCWPIDTTFYIEGDDSELVRYKYYLLKSLGLEGMNSDSAVPGLNRNNLHAREVAIPSDDTQRRISRIVGTLDDRIELCQRICKTLEEVAHTLFKSWFLDFDPVQAKANGREPSLPAPIADLFPDRFVDSELDLIPEGWRVGTLGEIARDVRICLQPAAIRPRTPHIALEHMPMRSIVLSEWGSADHVASGKLVFEKNQILFGKLRPYFHKVGVAPIDGVCSTDIVVVSPKTPDWFSYALGHMSSSRFVDYANASSTGTRMPRTNWQSMANYKIAVPPLQVSECFTLYMRPLISRITSTIPTLRCLSSVRDELLPKLISGRLRLQLSNQSEPATH